MATDLTPEAQAGYDAAEDAKCPHIATSATADAWWVGRHLRLNGAPRPEKAATSRGQSIRINGTHIFRLTYFPANKRTPAPWPMVESI